MARLFLQFLSSVLDQVGIQGAKERSETVASPHLLNFPTHKTKVTTFPPFLLHAPSLSLQTHPHDHTTTRSPWPSLQPKSQRRHRTLNQTRIPVTMRTMSPMTRLTSRAMAKTRAATIARMKVEPWTRRTKKQLGQGNDVLKDRHLKTHPRDKKENKSQQRMIRAGRVGSMHCGPS